jgi:hypothetical protein
MLNILILRRPRPLFAVSLPPQRSAVAHELDQIVAKIAGSVDAPKRKILGLPR